MSQLLRFKENQKYVVWDTETCGLPLIGRNLPWEIGYLVATGNKVEKVVSKYIKWDNLEVSAGAAQVTGFNRFEYESKAEDARIVLDEFNEYLLDPEYIVLFHNGINFDQYILNNWRLELGLPKDFSYLDRCLDTIALSKLYKLGVKKINREDWLSLNFKMSGFVQKGLKSNLAAMVKEFDIKTDGSFHAAATDIMATFNVFQKLIWAMEI